MIRYMRHVFWMLLRPVTHPFVRLRHQTIEEREAELARYEREKEAALNELKIELLLAHRQGLRDRARTQQQGNDSG